MPKISVQKTERLIAAVRENKAIYDPTQIGYADFGVKARLWSVVASKCGIKTGHEAKMMWKNLRDCYRIYRNRLYVKPNTKKWKFYEHMDFLEPYIKDRKFRDVVKLSTDPVVMENVDGGSRESDDIERSIHINENEGEFTTIQYWNDTEAKLLTTESGPEVTQVSKPPPGAESPESPVDSDHESFEDILPEALTNGTVDNSLKMFFDAMYASASQLPLSLQRRVKNKIFAAVLEGEEEAEEMRASPMRGLRLKTET